MSAPDPLTVAASLRELVQAAERGEIRLESYLVQRLNFCAEALVATAVRGRR